MFASTSEGKMVVHVKSHLREGERVTSYNRRGRKAGPKSGFKVERTPVSYVRRDPNTGMIFGVAPKEAVIRRRKI